ncbi:CWF19-like protein 1 [Onthophagus taurus]|uniref:CWF19-like protein 1 n=1 Tax=Onthophagus taurus TaxID=166361 RepID=UPI000C20E124|nr:CWF19-like protein 1 [Onthophagus taurus]
MESKIKIILCGDVEGKFNTFFNKIENINKKSGPFDLVLCVGNFFGINNKEFDDYKKGIKKVSVPTYVLGPNKEEALDLFNEETELCQNVSYLGKRGLYITTNGVKIAYLSGISSQNKTTKDFNFSLEEILALKDVCVKDNHDYRGVDILLTSQWPNKVNNLTKDEINVQNGSDFISWLAMQLKPRYHICGLEGIHYERSPYRINPKDSSLFSTVTRFIGLDRVGNPQKHKWIYALQLKPVDKMNEMEFSQKTTDETEAPYDLNDIENKILPPTVKRKHESQQYFYDMNAPSETKKEKRNNKKQKIDFDKSKCWFCLSSPSVEKHLIITVGTNVYVALAKGGIVEEHLLICPVQHYQSAIHLSDDTLDEIEAFKDAITKFYGRNDQVPVFFERNFKTSHMQVQCVPIPKEAQKELSEIFQDEAEGHGFKLEELDDSNRLNQVVSSSSPYFFLELPSGRKFYTRIQKSKDFPINFGREVLASGPILDKMNRIEWKDCILNREEEDLLVKNLRKEFEPFDVIDS